MKTTTAQEGNDLNDLLVYLRGPTPPSGGFRTLFPWDPISFGKAAPPRSELDQGRAKVDVLLACPAEQVPDAGQDLMTWLGQQPHDRARATLDLVALRVLAPWTDPAREDNRLAALELLAMCGRSEAHEITRQRLHARPISESHLYLASLPRLAPIEDPETRRGLADALVAALEDAAQGAGLLSSQVAELAVEVFRTLAKLAPEHAVGPVCHLLPAFSGLEQTALWNAVGEAAQRLGRAPGPPPALAEAVRTRWQALMKHPEPDTLDNFPGVAATLLELAGRCGLGWAAFVNELERHPLRPWILHQTIHRRLDFLAPAEQRELYVRTLRALREHGQARTFAAVSVLFAQAMPQDFLRALPLAVAEDAFDAHP